MKKRAQRRFVRLLIAEDDEPRVQFFERCFRLAESRWQAELGEDAPKIRHVWARNAGAAVGVLNRDPGRVYAGLMLDRDLTNQRLTAMDGHKTGEDVVESVVSKVDRSVPVLVHSTNESGGPRMAHRLEGAGFDVTFVPFYNLEAPRLGEWLDEVLEAFLDAEEE